MTTIILASPRRNGMSQIVPRARRRGSDQTIRRIVVDIVDVCTNLKSQARDRALEYKKFEYPIREIKASHEDYPAAAGDAPPAEAPARIAPTALEMLRAIDLDVDGEDDGARDADDAAIAELLGE